MEHDVRLFPSNTITTVNNTVLILSIFLVLVEATL